MIYKTPKNLILFITILLLVSCGGNEPTATSVPVAEDLPEGVIVLADISDDPAKKIARFQPLADYLAQNLTEYGIGRGEVKIASNMDTMGEWLTNGEVDLYFDSPYPAMIASDLSGAKPILRRWKDGVGEYYTVFFTRNDSNITSLNDMQGHMIAFDDPTSTSGYMLPLSYLLGQGLTVTEKTSSDATLDAGTIGYTFSNSDENTIQWVLSEKVSIGALDIATYEKDIPEETRANLTIIAQTHSVARQFAMVRPNMDENLLNAITTLLLELDSTLEGQAVLEAFVSTKFDEPPDGTDATFEQLQEMYNLVQENQ